MITLAIDTSTARGSVALLHDDRPVAEEVFERGALFAALVKLKPSQCDLIAVGVGPGSFTGIRAGIAAAKGFALPGDLPIKAVGSFDALALTGVSKMSRDCPQMCVLCDAKRDEVYFALYDATGRPTTECRIGPLEAIADDVHNPIWFVSPEIERFKDAIREQFGGFASVCDQPVFPSAAAVGWLAVQKFRADGNRGDKQIEPIYLRTPQYKTLS